MNAVEANNAVHALRTAGVDVALHDDGTGTVRVVIVHTEHSELVVRAALENALEGQPFVVVEES